jgi:hypothetical protein
MKLGPRFAKRVFLLAGISSARDTQRLELVLDFGKCAALRQVRRPVESVP